MRSRARSRRATPIPASTPSGSPCTGSSWRGASTRSSRPTPQTEFGFLLHDIGKVAIPDAILHKPEPLVTEERILMNRHPLIGWEILRDIPFLDEAARVVRAHHERYDGGGYPDGLRGDQIPLAARIFAVADAFDAITTDRPYRPAAPLADARQAIRRGAATQFDPTVVEALDEVPDATLERIRTEIA